jgi:hypothetical protein
MKTERSCSVKLPVKNNSESLKQLSSWRRRHMSEFGWIPALSRTVGLQTPLLELLNSRYKCQLCRSSPNCTKRLKYQSRFVHCWFLPCGRLFDHSGLYPNNDLRSRKYQLIIEGFVVDRIHPFIKEGFKETKQDEMLAKPRPER